MAAEEDDLPKLEELLAEGADVNVKVGCLKELATSHMRC